MRGTFSGAQHALDVAGDQVDLQVDPGAGFQCVQRGVLHRVRDEVDAQLGAFRPVRHAVDGEAHAVDGDRSLVGQVLAQRLGCEDAQVPAFADRLHFQHEADAVDVARNDVPAEAVVGAQRFFEVDRSRVGEARRACEGLGGDVDAEVPRRSRPARSPSCRRR
jgi:hypothetical protein